MSVYQVARLKDFKCISCTTCIYHITALQYTSHCRMIYNTKVYQVGSPKSINLQNNQFLNPLDLGFRENVKIDNV